MLRKEVGYLGLAKLVVGTILFSFVKPLLTTFAVRGVLFLSILYNKTNLICTVHKHSPVASTYSLGCTSVVSVITHALKDIMMGMSSKSKHSALWCSYFICVTAIQFLALIKIGKYSNVALHIL